MADFLAGVGDVIPEGVMNSVVLRTSINTRSGQIVGIGSIGTDRHADPGVEVSKGAKENGTSVHT